MTVLNKNFSKCNMPVISHSIWGGGWHSFGQKDEIYAGDQGSVGLQEKIPDKKRGSR